MLKQMMITYDKEISAGYIYFTSIGPGEAIETIFSQRLDVDFDRDEQIIAMRLFESGECEFANRLDYALQHEAVIYDETNHTLEIFFASYIDAEKTVSWDANIDLDKTGQILGLEILFADAKYSPDDELERVDADGKLKYINTYLIEFDS